MIHYLPIAPLETITLESGLNIVQIERPEVFSHLVNALQGPESRTECESDCGMPDARELLFIGDLSQPIDYDSLFLTKMMRVLIERLNQSDLQLCRETWSRMFSAVQEFIWEADLSIEIEQRLDMKKILSCFQPRLVHNDENFYDRIQSVISFAGALGEDKMLVLLNITKYLNQEELQYIKQDILRQSMQVLSVELTHRTIDVTERGNHFVDKDFVQFP